jgi:hypothetical protein
MANAIAIHYSLPRRIIRFRRVGHVCAVVFSAFCMHYPQCIRRAVKVRKCRAPDVPESRTKRDRGRARRGCRTAPVRRDKCRPLERHARAVTRKPSGITDITLWWETLEPAAIFCEVSGRRSQQKRSNRWGRWNNVGPYVPYDVLQTKGETCAKFGGDRFRIVDLCKVQTNKQTNKKEQKPFQLYT